MRAGSVRSNRPCFEPLLGLVGASERQAASLRPTATCELVQSHCTTWLLRSLARGSNGKRCARRLQFSPARARDHEWVSLPCGAATVVIAALERRRASRLAHESNPSNTVDQQAVVLANTRRGSFGTLPRASEPPRKPSEHQQSATSSTSVFTRQQPGGQAEQANGD